MLVGPLMRPLNWKVLPFSSVVSSLTLLVVMMAMVGSALAAGNGLGAGRKMAGHL